MAIGRQKEIANCSNDDYKLIYYNCLTNGTFYHRPKPIKACVMTTTSQFQTKIAYQSAINEQKKCKGSFRREILYKFAIHCRAAQHW